MIYREFISLKVTQILSLDQERPMRFGTNIKGAMSILPQIKMVQIIIGQSESKLKIRITSEYSDSST